MPPVGFEPTVSAVERLKTYALDLASTGIGKFDIWVFFKNLSKIHVLLKYDKNNG
jgi:hypothetical protein